MSASRTAPLIPLPRPQAEGALAERDDEALMTLAAGEHRAAFEALAVRYLSRLVSYCAKFVGNLRIGEELAQESLFELWVQRRRYRSGGKFRVFLFTLARNRCLNQARSDRTRRRWDLGEDARPAADPPGTPNQLDVLLEEERVREVRSALLDLPPKLREAVLLRFDQGLEYAEIARVVGRPESTVRSRVFLAMKELRRAVAEEGEP